MGHYLFNYINYVSFINIPHSIQLPAQVWEYGSVGEPADRGPVADGQQHRRPRPRQ